MDCFYAAVEMRENPAWRGTPLAVGGSPEGRGVISTANYVARRYGIKSAMSSAKAMKLCPELRIVRPHFDLYKQESQKVREIFSRYTDLVEPLSLDEAYLDVTESRECHGSATLIAQKIRQEIYEETELTASAGVAPNKFLAKVASDWNKPNGQMVITPEMVSRFVKKLPVQKINGVGKVTSRKMHLKGLYTCADLQKLSLLEMSQQFGKWGERLYEICRGIDHRSVVTSRVRKSLSIERTFSKDIQNWKECQEMWPKIFSEFEKRFKRSQVDGRIRSIYAKVKFNDFQNCTREMAVASNTSLIDLNKNAQQLAQAAISSENKPFRLLGVGVKLKVEEMPKTKENKRQLTFEL